MSQDYKTRLDKIIKERKEQNISIDDITPLRDFMTHTYKGNAHNHIYEKNLQPMLCKQYKKRHNKANFDRKLFSKIIFNCLYEIRQDKDDLVPYYATKGTPTYNYYASHQYIRRELEHLTIDDIMLLSWELSKNFKK